MHYISEQNRIHYVHSYTYNNIMLCKVHVYTIDNVSLIYMYSTFLNNEFTIRPSSALNI